MRADVIAPPVPTGAGRRALALAVISAAQLTVVLDVSIVNVALPSMQRDLGFSATGLEWVVNAYALAFGGLLLLGGRIADVYDRRSTLIAGLVLLVISSTAGGLAPGAGWLIGARAAQGVAGALIAPSALALIAVTFAEGSERNRAMGVYAAMSGAGGALGNVLGGVLTTGLSWRWVLFVNVPIGVLAILLAPRAFASSPRSAGRIDPVGALTATAGVSLIVYGLMHAASDSWGSLATYGPLIGGPVVLLVFLVAETRQRSPLMPLRLWADRNRAGAYVVVLAVGAATLAVFYFLTLFMQTVLGFTALRTGFGFLVFAVGGAAAAGASSRFVGRTGPRPLIGLGVAVMASGTLWLSFLDADAGYLRDLAGPLALCGFGVGMCFVPLTLAAVARVDADDSGIASALLNTCQQVGGALGLAVFGTIAATATRHRLDATGPGSRILGDALTHGYGLAFLAATVTLAVACVIAVAAIGKVADEPAAVPDLTMMILVHNAFRRDLNRLRIIATDAVTDPAALAALRTTWQTFSEYLLIHHTAEDETLWPILRERLGDRTDRAALLTDMVDEHAQLDPLLATVTADLAEGHTAALPMRFDRLAEILTAHLDHEESAALPLIRETLTPRQWKAFGDDQRRRVGITGGARFFPWLLDGATDQDRTWALALLPPPLRLVYRFVWQPAYQRRNPVIDR